MNMETPQSVCNLLIQQLDARVDSDHLLVSAPVEIGIGLTAAQLDAALDALLEDVGALLERTLATAEAKVAESWISDASGEPLGAISEQLSASDTQANWTLESPLGFPDDDRWLGLLIRRAFEKHEKIHR